VLICEICGTKIYQFAGLNISICGVKTLNPLEKQRICGQKWK